MRFFSSSSTHKIDAKGRVSVPAAFRKVLEQEAQPGVVLIPRLRGEAALEGLGYARFEQMAEAIDGMNPLDPTTIALSNKVLGQACHIQLEDTGRILLGPELRRSVGLADQALFVGLGRTFQIWNPEAYAARAAELERQALDNFDKLPWGGAR